MKNIRIAVAFMILTFILPVKAVYAAPSDWAKPAVSYMNERNLSENELAADYQKNITRAEFAAVLINVYEQETQKKLDVKAHVFNDIGQSKYAAKIEKAYEAGLINGTSKTAFDPDKPLTREQAATIIGSFLKTVYPDYPNAGKKIAFTDADQISAWAKDAVTLCVSNGIMVGVSDSTFAPKVPLTREQALVLLHNMVNKKGTVGAASAAPVASAAPAPKPRLSQGNTILNRGDNFIPYGNKVYFIANTNEDGKLYELDKTKKDSAPKQLLSNTVDGLNIQDGFIYTLEHLDNDKRQLVKINAQTMQKTVLEELVGLGSFAIDGDYIYFITGNKYLKKMRLDGTGSSTLYDSDTAIVDVRVTDGWVYFIKDKVGLFRVSVDGSAPQLIYGDNIYRYVIYGKSAYVLLRTEKTGTSLTPYDLYMIPLGNNAGKGSIILDRISAVYTTEDAVYAYNGEPTKANKLFKITGGKSTALTGPAVNVLTENNAQNLYFSQDGKLYYSVFRPLGADEAVSRQTYQYTNVIDLGTGVSTGIFGGDTIIHSTRELALVYGKMPYTLWKNTDPKDRQSVSRAEQVVKEIITPDMNETQIEKAVHDYVVRNTVYSLNDVPNGYEGFSIFFYDNGYNPIYVEAFSVDAFTTYGVLVNGHAVCQGYAETVKLLLNMAGVECYVVTGTATSQTGTGLHAWNIVKIDGNYYQLDATWDDPTPDVAGRVLYNYYNLTDEQMLRDHVMDDPSAFPRCTTKWK